MIKDFWNTNLNPITMHPTVTDNQAKESESIQKKMSDRVYVTVDLSENEEYVLSKEVIKTLGIGAKKIKQAILCNGLEFKVFISNGSFYYKKCDIENIEIVVPSQENMDQYISSAELRKDNNWSYWDMWDNARKNKWKKKKFNGNMTWFLRSEVLRKC